MNYIEIKIGEDEKIKQLSELASAIVREHYDSIIGKEQNSYMIGLFQSVDGINGQLARGYSYFVAEKEGEAVGFLAFYRRGDELYLSKFYLKREYRGLGLGREMLGFVADSARKIGLKKITLNVNKNNTTVAVYEKMGFVRIGEEKNDIGNGFFMDDYVYCLAVPENGQGGI